MVGVVDEDGGLVVNPFRFLIMSSIYSVTCLNTYPPPSIPLRFIPWPPRLSSVSGLLEALRDAIQGHRSLFEVGIRDA